MSLVFKAVSDDVFEEVSKEGIISCIKSKTISDWEAEDPKKRISFGSSGSSSKSKSDSVSFEVNTVFSDTALLSSLVR